MIKKGIKVKILTGKDKNKDGDVIEIDRKNNRAKVKGINMVKKHVKTTKEKKGGIVSKENFIHLSNKPEGSNYANCDGYYIKYENKVVNNTAIFLNEHKGRFIGKSGSGWVLTGQEWLEAIIKESVNKTEHSFGGFHGSTNSSSSIITTTWKDYEVFVCEPNEIIENYEHTCKSMVNKVKEITGEIKVEELTNTITLNIGEEEKEQDTITEK